MGPSMTHNKHTLHLTLGAVLWAFTLTGLAMAGYAVYESTTRPSVVYTINTDQPHNLLPGDLVYVQTAAGLESAGEIVEITDNQTTLSLSLKPTYATQINASTRASLWQTPFSVEDALDALLPPDIQHDIATQIAAEWQVHQAALSSAWNPIVTEMASDFLTLVHPQIEAALQKREDIIWHIAQAHGERLSQNWPAIQQQLTPILQQHLTPVLARLINAALAEAPKLNIAWLIARGRYGDAYQQMLDWMAQYLTQLPENDKQALLEALHKTWLIAREEPTIKEIFSQMGHQVLEDEKLASVLADIYREAVADNPQTAAFFRDRLIESPRVRKEFYDLMERFAPTARHIAARCLFQADGATRPEIVHLVRSIALRRRVSWITLTTPQATTPQLEANSSIPVTLKRPKP